MGITLPLITITAQHIKRSTGKWKVPAPWCASGLLPVLGVGAVSCMHP